MTARRDLREAWRMGNGNWSRGFEAMKYRPSASFGSRRTPHWNKSSHVRHYCLVSRDDEGVPPTENLQSRTTITVSPNATRCKARPGCALFLISATKPTPQVGVRHSARLSLRDSMVRWLGLSPGLRWTQGARDSCQDQRTVVLSTFRLTASAISLGCE